MYESKVMKAERLIGEGFDGPEAADFRDALAALDAAEAREEAGTEGSTTIYRKELLGAAERVIEAATGLRSVAPKRSHYEIGKGE
jgi:hypothetical protein